MAKDSSVTFRIRPSLNDRVGRAAYNCDKNKSEFITRCIEFAIPFFEADPSAVDTIGSLYELSRKKDER